MSGKPKTVVGGRFARAGAAPPAPAAPLAPVRLPRPQRRASPRPPPAFAASTAALDEVHVRSRWIVHQAQPCGIGRREDVDDTRFWIERTAFPVRAACGVWQHQRARLAAFARRDRWREDRTDLVEARDAQRLRLQFGRPVDQIRFRDALTIERRRLRGKWLCRRIPLAGHVPFLNGPLDDRPHRLARHAIEGVNPALFRRHADRLDRFSVDSDVHQNAGRGEVPIPDVVMDGLKLPVALAGVQVEAHDAVGEEVRAGPMTAVIIAGCHLGGQVHAIGGFVDRNRAPVTCVARV